MIVNYFEEVPVVIVAVSLAAIGASGVFALFDAIRKGAASDPT